MSKRRFTVVAHLNPKRQGRVVALPLAEVEKGHRTLATLQEVTKTRTDLHPDDLYAVFKVESVKLPPIKVLDDDARPVEVKELQVLFSLHEMDFGKEEGEDVPLVQYLGGKLVKRRAGRWEFEFDESVFQGTPHFGEHVTYFRIASATQPDRYLLVPLDPEEVGYLGKGKREGQHYEVAFKLSIYDPGYEAGPGEDSAKQVDRVAGKTFDAPVWWEDYKNGKPRGSGRTALPTLRVQYDAFEPVTDQELLDAIGDYYQELHNHINDHWTAMNGAITFFSQRPDDLLKKAEEPVPSLWSILKGAYTVASLFLPALSGLGVAIEFIEAFKLADKETPTPTSTTQDTKDQVKAAVDAMQTFGKATIQFVKDMDAFVSAARDGQGKEIPQLRVSEFVRRALARSQTIWEQQLDAAKAWRAAAEARLTVRDDPAAGTRRLTERERRDMVDQVRHSTDLLKGSRTPRTDALLSALIVEFMNSYQLGLFTYTNDEKDGPASHSHVAGPNVNLERHAFFCLRDAFGGALVSKETGQLHVPRALKSKHLTGLKVFHEKVGRHAVELHVHNDHKIMAKNYNPLPKVDWSWDGDHHVYELKTFK